MRRLLVASVLALSAVLPSFASAQTLKVVMHSDLKALDPIWSGAYITRNYGYLVYDVLFAVDENFRVKPQMVESHSTSDDGLTWTFKLRDGLEWHDGQKVMAEDCIASLKRWSARDSMGQKLAQSIVEYKAVDPLTFQIVLKEKFGALLEAIGKPSVVVPFMMPKRVAETDPFKQIDDYVGSGPFVFKKEEWKPG
jgi:peptide/nickel transport system substrate-binding protein